MRVGASLSPVFGKEKQHEERAPARRNVCAPIREVLSLVPAARRSGKAHVDVPPRIPWVIRVRKPHREGSETPLRTPATFSDKLVESCVEYGAVDSPFERLVMILAEPVNGTRPRSRIIGLARQIAPKDGAARLRELLGKRSLNLDETITDKLLDLRTRKCARLFIGRHGNPLIAWPQ